MCVQLTKTANSLRT